MAPRFERVAEEFVRNLNERGELGAAFAAVYKGEPVVDIWGGIADREHGRLWSEDTLQLIFSGTKGLTAICLLILIDRGALDLDAAVCRYWREFAAEGKAHVTVREVVSHRARLPGFTTPVTVDQLVDDRHMATLLAAQRQLADPRATNTYHALTFGWLCGELVRRIDGRSIGRFFAEEVAEPLDLELFIGLPDELEPRVARLELAESWSTSLVFNGELATRDELARAVWGNPPVFEADVFPWNSPAYHQAELPGVNAIGSARAVAKLYSSLEELMSAQTLELGRTELARRVEPLLGGPQAFGVGFELQSEIHQLGPPADAYGHTGAGGSVHGAWPSHSVGFSYAMNLMREDQDAGDPRPRALLRALYASLET